MENSHYEDRRIGIGIGYMGEPDECRSNEQGPFVRWLADTHTDTPTNIHTIAHNIQQGNLLNALLKIIEWEALRRSSINICLLIR